MSTPDLSVSASFDTSATTRLRPGDRFAPRTLHDLNGAPVSVPDPERRVHLQLRRYAGCPICSLHLRAFVHRHAELAKIGVREVVVFHSSAEDLRRVHTDVPFDVVADPTRALYAALGVGTSSRAVLDPRVWPTAVRALALGASADPTAGQSDGSFGLPADFLIAPDGNVVASKYGAHADDQWSFDEVMQLAQAARR